MEYCVRCTHPNTRPRIQFNSDGVCNGCLRAEEKKSIDWEEKEREFREVAYEIVARSPNREYDCVIPVSGGKDSTFQTWYAINKLGLRPLCINIAPYLGTDVGLANLRNLAERLPVDVLSFIPNQSVQTKLSRIGLTEHADPLSYPFLLLVFPLVTRIALQKKIPLVLYGENGEREYGGSTNDEFTKLDNKGVMSRIKSDKSRFLSPSDWSQYGLTPHEAAPFIDPTDEEMSKIGLERLFFSDYTPWTNNHHLHIALNVVGGFQMPATRASGTFTYGYSTDDDLYDLYIWIIWPKFGFGRATKYTSKDIQEGKITRAEAINLVRDYDGEFPWRALDRYCEKTGLSEQQFWDAIARNVGDEENLRRQAEQDGTEMKIPSWEKIGRNKWRHIKTIHGEERRLELPMSRPEINR